MNVTMPDGTVIEGVPEGTTKAQLQAKYSAHIAAQAAPEQSTGQQIGSYLGGIRQGLYDLPQSAMELGARGTDAIGLTNGAHPALHKEFKSDAEMMAPGVASGDTMAAGGRIGGEVLGTLPLTSLKIGGAVASRLPTLARIASGALQGGAGAALTSSSSDAPLAEQVGLGAGLGGILPAAGALAKFGGKLIPTTLGNLTTGAGESSVRQAFQAGEQGGAAGKAFTGSMRGDVPMEQVVTDAKAALSNMRAERGAAYRAGMANISKDKTVLDFAPIEAEIGKLDSVKQFKGVDLSPKTAGVRTEISDAITKWKALNPAEYHTPEGFDALKQQIGDIRDSLPFNTPERVVADGAYNAVKKSIQAQAPAYSKVMADYSKASALVDDLQKELSLGQKGNPNTALRKLQSVMRDNANTSWGKRADYAGILSDNGAINLMPALAGQALSSSLPRGLAKYGDMGLALAAASTNPSTLAALPLASPRVVGELAYGLGAAKRGSAALLPQNLPRLPSFSPALGITGAGLAYQN